MDEMKQKIAEQFSTIVQKGLYNDADEMLSDLRESVDANEYLSVNLCITAAFLYNKLGKKESELYYLQQGFLLDQSNPSLFISLADYYSKTNVKQELICLYQAKYLAERSNNEEIVLFVSQIISAIETNKVCVPKTSIIILSYNTMDYLMQCLDSLKNTVSMDRCQIVVVDNASTDGSLEYLHTLDWITLVENSENRGFPGGCNDGINAAEKGNDIWLLNSDTIVPVNALFWLKMGLYESENIGSCGSITNSGENGQKVEIEAANTFECIQIGEKLNVPQAYPYVYKSFLIGFSLLLKRTALEKTGVLDERFNPGNSEDVDLGLRMIHEGYQNILCFNSFIYHYGHKSFDQLQKTVHEYNDLLDVNSDKLVEKLGFDPFDFLNGRMELIEEMKAEKDAFIRVLELNCSMGAGAAIIKTMYPNAEYVGIEENEKTASYARTYGDVYNFSINSINLPEKYNGYFDYIIVGDALHFSTDPKALLVKLSGFLKKKGKLLISISNLRHYSVMLPLLIDGRFSYTENGIIQKGMTTLFTENEAARLISENGFSIKGIKAVAGDEPSEQEKKYLKSLSQLFEQSDIDDYTTKKYIYKVEKLAW